MAGGNKRSADETLVVALAGGASAATAAAQAEVSARTVCRRLRDSAFRARVDEARAELVRQAVGRLAEAGGLASDTLRVLVESGKEATRLGAARGILEYMFRGIEVDTLARQVAELQRQVEEWTRGGGNAQARTGEDPAAGGQQGRGRTDAVAGEVAAGPGPAILPCRPDPG
jgi:hypothetical protein